MFEYIERKTGYTKDELTSSCRKQELCLVRHAHWYLLRKSRKITLDRIGRYIWEGKHSTVLIGIRKIENFLELHDKKTEELIELLSLGVNKN